MAAIVWFRDDLRLADHAALSEAAKDQGGLIALFLLDEVSEEARPLGAATKWWLHHSLHSLSESLKQHGVSLVLRRGSAEEVLPAILAETGAASVFWNRRYGPERAIDARLKLTLRKRGINARSFAGSLLFEPHTIATGEGTPYRVYSAFWRACLREAAPAQPLPVPVALRAANKQPRSETIESLVPLPTQPNWAAEFSEHWQPGEASANARLQDFLDDQVNRYQAERDVPSETATSRLSPHLRWGEISPRAVWYSAVASQLDVGMFLSEIGWREFAWHTLFHRGVQPHNSLECAPLDHRFEAFPWRSVEDAELTLWQQGKTGFELVDAGMRELWRSGTMHNRVRMVAASFLVKNMLVDWRVGESWFWDTLLDADRASNPFNWQWIAGCGADAAPYFRVFNPTTQLKKFDADRRYSQRWAPESVLNPPILDLGDTRLRALEAFDSIKRPLR
ncbi:deoxyribodipyrimidine photo-lyase [Leucobacter sp. UT-8R-CII-1-4]|uniref:cryptochrome/photolyase family protein n=1 Tax=Leucobacter sp. UT-8R-CII-1-4 TaxID=3040075 RepID=UPI0024A836AC|nr:deoxyribodipyrimidine photo-lyase [Leucobacter sp. UT-8R-CII-1-4]MDI6021935.1 deoxyribodipyrimidine photo-lyase [Leucobacter sp. UT-8R-CII-1-4]